MDPRTRILLEAPIASTLLRLALPNMLIMLAQAAAGLVETYFVGKLGTDALASSRATGRRAARRSRSTRIRPSKSRPHQGLVKVRTTTKNQKGEAVQVSVGNLVVPRRPT